MSGIRCRRLLGWLFPAAFLVILSGALGSPQKMTSIEMDRARQMLRDAKDAVKKHYYDPKFHGVDLDAAYQQYDDRIKNAANFNTGLRMVAAFLSTLKDSHTFFQPPMRPYRLDTGFRMQLFGDTAFVTRVRPGTDAESKIHPGDEVVGYDSYAVNRTDFHDLSYTFDALMPQMKTQLGLRDPDGKTRQAQVDSKAKQGKKTLDFTDEGDGEDVWNYIRAEESEDHVVRQRYMEAGDITIWKMPEFFLEDGQVDRIFDTVRKHKTLILDLRGDPGGAVVTLERMLGNVFDHDVKIADRIARKESKPDTAKTVGGRAYTGKIIVLVDSQSASAAELFARVMQLENRGTVLGDRSSGSVMEARDYGYQQGADTVISYGFSVTDADLIMKDGKSLEHVGVTPDEIVLPTARNLANGEDPVLARAVEIAGGKLDPAAAGKLFPFEWVPF